MKNSRLGTPIIGNFSAEQSISDNEILYVNKRHDFLIIKTKQNDNIKLFPKDDGAEIVINHFGIGLDENNDSIYTVKTCWERRKENIVIVLYLFKQTRRIELESESLNFYLERLETSRLITDGIMKKTDEIQFLEKEFLDGRSIFVIDEYQGVNSNKFQIFGNKYRAECEYERPGVVKISKIIQTKTINRNNDIVQYFGNVKFVSFDEAMQIHGHKYENHQVVIDDIFQIWKQYENYKEEISNNEIRKRGYIRYKAYTINNGLLNISFDNDADYINLFFGDDNSDVEFDIITYETSADLPNSIDDILSYKKENQNNIITVGSCVKLEGFNIWFYLPKNIERITSHGVLIHSDRNVRIEKRRRDRIYNILNSRNNPTANMIMRLTAGDADSQTGGLINDKDIITTNVLDKMFGDDSFKITENYREAIKIALNTPDIALIQGPPGTGKTTLIKGIVARLNEMSNKNYKILISTEQHDALYNVTDKLSENKLLPPFIVSKRFNEKDGNQEDSNNFMKDITNFQYEFQTLCNNILKDKKDNKNDFSAGLSQIIYCIQSIRLANYSNQVIRENLDVLYKTAIQMSLSNTVIDVIQDIKFKFNFQIENEDCSNEMLDIEQVKQKLSNQRTTIEDYKNDGSYQLKELQRCLRKRPNYEKLLIEQSLLSRMTSGDNDALKTSFDEYIKYIDYLKDKILSLSVSNSDENILQAKSLFDELMYKLQDAVKSHKKDFFEVVEELKYKLLDIDNVNALVKRYTNIIGSTCAQAGRSLDRVELNSHSCFDYVIIDEAARANPLDIMLPILMGIRVILVGDQKQLPHFIESKEVRDFLANDKYKNLYDKELLEKSLFGLIFERVEDSWEKKKLVFKRHIRINEQHRMHPSIGDFISKEFYNGEITNGPKTSNNINDYNVFGNKNVAWLNIPIIDGMEEGKPSYFRMKEVDKVLETINIIVHNLKGMKSHIGVISFYKKQIEIIESIISNKYPDNISTLIECGTVDSFQGKEFDIVLLSTVRSNAHQTPSESLGFIHYSDSRINVALSRAKTLLVVIGDAETFMKNSIFRNFINYVKKEGFYA
ncbi:MAG: AAA family ATPase [Spirochaetaceae bacterium]|nr:AAA family ATPase [Spirochaetaceae bacterium]